MNNENATLFNKLKNKKDIDSKASIKKLGIQDLGFMEESFTEEVSVNFITRLGGQIFQFYSLRGEEWTPGEVGLPGELGSVGLSPYDIALSEGFVGTLEEWKLSLDGVTVIAEDTLSFKTNYLDSLN